MSFQQQRELLSQRRFSLAPMLDYTHRHFRYFIRLMTKHTTLYTEMITPAAILRGKKYRLLDFDSREKPLVLQLGGDNKEDLAQVAQIAEELGYDEINFNVGCPSDKVMLGNFGACLMHTPSVVADCVEYIQARVKIPVTIKHRLGTDSVNDFDSLCRFVELNSQAGCRRFIVHARIAILSGISPKDNRKIPPIQYDRVYELKKIFPQLQIEINGEIKTLNAAQEHLHFVDGVMIGRASIDTPYLYADADGEIFQDPHKPEQQEKTKSRAQIFAEYSEYAKRQMSEGVPANRLFSAILNLFHGMPQARLFRQKMSGYLPLYAHDFNGLHKALQQDFGQTLLAV